jgi:hypothetical protein
VWLLTPAVSKTPFEAGIESAFFADRWFDAQIFDNLVGREIEAHRR